jgi:hypothetical protein
MGLGQSAHELTSKRLSRVDVSTRCKKARPPRRVAHMTAKRNRKYTGVKRPIATCRGEVRLIADYLTNNLSFSERAAFEAHLTGCRDCGAFLTTYRKTIELTRTFLSAPNRQHKPHLQLH